MKLYEILAKGIERTFLKELQSSTINKDLETTANNIGAAKSARTGDDTTGAQMAGDPMMGDPMMSAPGMGAPGMDAGMPQAAGQPGLEPDPSMMGDDGLGGEEELETKQVDDVVLSQVDGMKFWNYDHGGSVTSPEKILQMDMDQLTQLHGSVRNAAQMYRIGSGYGHYSDPTSEWYNDFLEFVDKVLDLKKRSDQPVKKKRQGKTAKWEQKKPSKNAKPKSFKKPPKPKGAQ